MASLTTLFIVLIVVKFVFGRGHGGIPPLTVYQGTQAKEGMFPSIGWVFLIDYQLTTFRCAATLIDNEWAVSAAHCFCNQSTGKPTNFLHANLIFGDVDYTIRSEWHQESSFDYIIHEEYNSTYRQNDIALLHLKQKIKTTEYVKPQRLSKSSNNTNQYENCQVAGWGKKGESEETTQLLFANLSLTRNSECKKWWKYFNQSTMLCAGSSTPCTCVVDSGGPLYCTNTESEERELVGVFFGISTYEHTTTTGVYIKVSAYSEWIESKTKKLLDLWIISITIPCVVFVLVLIVIIVIFIRRKKKTELGVYESMHAGPHPPDYSRHI